VSEDQKGYSAGGGRQQVYDADFEDRDVHVSADVLPKQEAEPASDNEEHHAARAATHNHMETQAIHRGDYKGEDKYGVRHRGCGSVFQW